MRWFAIAACAVCAAGCPNPECPTGTRFLHGACVPEPDAADADTDTDTDTDTDLPDTDTGTTWEPWTGPMMYRFDERRTGAFPGPAPQGGAPKWVSAVGEACSQPVVSAGRVYATTADRNVEAVDAASGAPVWTFGAGGVYVSGAAVSGDRVVAADRIGQVFGIDAITGAEAWRFQGDQRCAPPAIAGSSVYVACGPLYELDLAAGTLVRSTPVVDFEILQGPTVSADRVFLGGGPLQAFERADLTLAWQLGLSNTRSTPPTDGLHLWIATLNGMVALGANQGGVEWGVDGFSTVNDTSPALFDGVVYTGTSRALRARDAETGDELWSAQLPVRPQGGISVAGSGVFVVDEAGGVHAFARSDGAPLWFHAAEACSSPALEGGVLFVGTQDGLLALE